MTSPSVDNAILQLKAEIIAQDWRLSPKRVKQLEAAFCCLLEHFKTRKAIHGMLVMADNVLRYVNTHGTSPPATIDFLKEAMAHVVSCHEELVDDASQEEAIFRSLFAHFSVLKEKILQQSVVPVPVVAPSAPGLSSPPAVEQKKEGEGDPLSTLHQLIEEFKNSLLSIGDIGLPLCQSLDLWLHSPAVVALLTGEPLADCPAIEERPLAPRDFCPATHVRIVRVGGLSVALESDLIALVRPLKPSQTAHYLQVGSVPLGDFSRFWLKLSQLFSGSLSLVKERVLRELSLPLILPQGPEFSDAPPRVFSTLVVISHGNWHGALACEAVGEIDRIMSQVSKQQNGDLAGTAYLDDGEQFPLLDPLCMLRREGLLVMR